MSKISTSKKAIYGLGMSAKGIKDGIFQVFLFFYFSQVLGLDPTLAGTSGVIALLFDAVSDPLVGILSDGWKSKKWGRRHPFMFASAIPLGLFTVLLFTPPEGLGQSGLFTWLTIFTILVRLALTLFMVPHSSMGAEMSTDYDERTSITAFRIMFGAFVAPVVIIIGFTMFFIKTEEISHGLFNVAAYPRFAIFCAILMVLFILISTWGTRKLIPNLPQPKENQKKQSFWQHMSGIQIAFKMKSFVSLILFVVIIYIGIGIGVVFSTYYGTYYFEFTEIEMAALPIGSAVGALLALAFATKVGRMFDKKWGAFGCAILFALFFSMPFNLRLLGLFPENNSSSLLPTYVLTLIIAYCFLWITFSLANSMMAEVIDEYELETNKRQEGLFFSFMSFAFKCTTGLGTFLAGLLLSWIEFPTQANIEEVPANAIHGLGLVGGPIIMFIFSFAFVFILFYPITKERYQQIRQTLNERHAQS